MDPPDQVAYRLAMSVPDPQILTVDVGTGSVRAALVDLHGTVSALRSAAHPTRYPRHGWVEQAPADWWAGACRVIGATLRAGGAAAGQVVAVVCCGQMHAPVLIGADGALVRDHVPLWNDKRGAAAARALNAQADAGELPPAVNPATTAWPGVKLAWIAEHDPAALDSARALLMPKDYLNFRLTGVAAMDWTEAGSSFLSDPGRGCWSDAAAAALGVPRHLLPPILRGEDQVGWITAAAAEATGLGPGTPVFVGVGDYPAAVLGTGATGQGQIADITGTSFLLTRMVEAPIRHPEVMNIAAATGGWGAFAVVDAAGDAIRWASRALDDDRQDYPAQSALAGTAPPGAGGIMFLPFLTGERLGQGPDSRAAFLGLTARHGPAQLHRAVMEGVVLAMQEAFAPIAGTPGAAADRIVAAAGGARSDLWLQIKADVFDLPVVATAEVEAGLVGSAALGLAGLGHHASAAEAAATLVRYRPAILPDPDRHALYAELASRFAAIRRHTAAINAILEQDG